MNININFKDGEIVRYKLKLDTITMNVLGRIRIDNNYKLMFVSIYNANKAEPITVENYTDIDTNIAYDDKETYIIDEVTEPCIINKVYNLKNIQIMERIKKQGEKEITYYYIYHNYIDTHRCFTSFKAAVIYGIAYETDSTNLFDSVCKLLDISDF